LKLWTYQGHDQVRSVAGWTFFGVTEGDKNPGALVAAQVPHPAAKDMLKKALTSPDLFVLKAGTTVKLDLSGIPDAAERERVQEALTKRLQAIQCQVGPNGTIELAASIEGPKEREISFIRSGDYKVPDPPAVRLSRETGLGNLGDECPLHGQPEEGREHRQLFASAGEARLHLLRPCRASQIPAKAHRRPRRRRLADIRPVQSNNRRRAVTR
jgi:hypothetical protein